MTSPTSTEAAVEERIELQRRIDNEVLAARRKRAGGESLTDREWMLVQYDSGGACAVCSSRGLR